MNEIDQLLTGVAKLHSREELEKKLALGRPLRVKLGVDPTAPDIHLGHTIAIEKLRQFQQLGHQAVLIIGDFTATIGDPTGRSATRPPLTRAEVLENAKTYTDQAFRILDKEKTEVVYNGDWFCKMRYEEVIRLNARISLQQILAREDFRNRVDSGQSVSLHELQYPILQGWDSVEVAADVELGGTDQLFNLLVGRELQKAEGQEPQVALTMPLLEGLDGVKKMSKSYGNYIGVAENPDDMFGKAMSISDELMDRWYCLLLGRQRQEDLHPMEAKKQLASALVSRFHGEVAAEQAKQVFAARFSKKEEAIWPEIALPSKEETLLATVARAFADAWQSPRSNGDVRRLIQQGSIQLDGEKQTDPKVVITPVAGQILKLDKKRSVRFSG